MIYEAQSDINESITRDFYYYIVPEIKYRVTDREDISVIDISKQNSGFLCFNKILLTVSGYPF
eukprot:snap_masked-scaffold_27-processed-gene-1.30-mRNA-1 protein AED:1.00 eAED:1.00 QI:0/0/0/0/1/1/2/0/62